MADTSPDSPDWASLPAHLLDTIGEKLIDLSDFIRFSVVCKPWLYAATIDNQLKQQHRALLARKQIPMLMVPSSDPKDNNSDGEGQEKRSLYSLTRCKLYDFQLSLSYRKRCCGSSHGWLATVEDNYAITLINPFSGVSPITLPPLMQVDSYTDFSEMEYDIVKVVLSADPYMAPDSYQVAAIYSIFSLVALIKSDDAAWTYISKEQLSLASDVICYESQFHVIDEWCGLTKIKSFSGIDHSIELEAIIKPDLTLPTIQSSYLVESSTGELLNVVRYLEQKDEIDQYVTWYFKVYKLSNSSEQPHPTWVEIESIGGDALFLGDNYSFSLLASQFPGCWPNSIYFTDDFIIVQHIKPLGPRDMGIFNLVDKSFRMHYTHDPSHNGMPPPIWIVPTPLAK
ncbi:F-box protein At4g35733-like [Rhododendron vialii]|uniref:F-box protein At4g35733-like n=1 Tax=Rhododendron vialii TaxID=182163 RepID=UPI00265DFA50|nr:F-box protein At4g35733-like [Rhododendron vialii]